MKKQMLALMTASMLAAGTLGAAITGVFQFGPVHHVNDSFCGWRGGDGGSSAPSLCGGCCKSGK